MKKTIIAGIAGAAIAGGALGFAAPAVATPCTYFSPTAADNGQGICGLPNVAGTFGNIQQNLTNNFSPTNAAKNVGDNFNPTTASKNLQQSITKGVGTDG